MAMFGLLAARAGLVGDPGPDLPAFPDLHRRIAAGEVNLGMPEAMRTYAHVHLRRALTAIQSPGS